MTGATKRSEIVELLKQIQDTHAVLFLGSGSTKGCLRPDGKPGLDGDGLAKEILADLNEGTAPSFQANLMEAAEFFTAVRASARGGLDKLVQERLRDLQPTIGHCLAASFPWHAVVTTNYNAVAEDAWGTAHAEGFAAREIIEIRNDEDINKHAGDTSRIRLYKPHGCISIHMQQDARMVITPEDYFKSKQLRPQIYEAIRSAAQECTTLFVGYSLADYTFRNLFYEICAEMGAWTNRSYSVGPDHEEQRFEWRARVMDRNFNTTLINDYFDTFMLRLVLARGSLAPALKKRVEDSWPAIQNANPGAMYGLKLSEFQALTD